MQFHLCDQDQIKLDGKNNDEGNWDSNLWPLNIKSGAELSGISDRTGLTFTLLPRLL